ncbi:beta-1,4 N-acetylgalactosaminyltransferase 1-like [Branchiostoma floridae x Branchiostoma belcheri]
MAEKTKLLFLFLTGFCCGFVTLGSIGYSLLGIVGNSGVMPPYKKNIIRSPDIPFTLRDGFLSSKRMSCNCSDEGATILNFEAFEFNELKKVEGQRKAELQKFKDRKESSKEILLIVNGSVPLSYPAQGVIVAPEEWENIPGLKVVDNILLEDYKVDPQPPNVRFMYY